MKACQFSLFILLFSFTCSAQNAELLSGPMPGYADMRTCKIWLQTNVGGEFQIEYSPVKPNKDVPTVLLHFTIEGITHFTHVIELTALEPGTDYFYEIQTTNGKRISDEGLTFKTQPLWKHRTDPPDFTIAIGSCTYVNESIYDRPGEPYGGDYEIFSEIENHNPDLMLWLGDNVYFRPTDWTSAYGMRHRYTHTRSVPELNSLLKSCHHYAIWDDHDFGPNNSNRSFDLKNEARTTFSEFWANRTYGSDEKGIYSSFTYNDVELFLLDNRFFRSPMHLLTEKNQVFGKEQIDWLIESLKDSHASYKLVASGGQILSDLAMFENYAQYPIEREYLLNRIKKENIKNVVFLTGDRHYSELSKMDFADGRSIYDLTVSPLTSGTYDPERGINHHRVKGTSFNKRNFALIHFSGTFENRTMEIELKDTEGKLVWVKVLDYSDFKVD